nr:MAG TPA: hypothetical protein [Bacteriophage sp.]DAY32677.1 MAG TPA: hypothetical protein [Caudoviricetes sp.]DAY37566.1 MAG TPA: hypothetical protein [Caudoviricetes sp.]
MIQRLVERRRVQVNSKQEDRSSGITIPLYFLLIGV